MKSLIGLLPATAGRIRYGGEDITKLEPERRAHRGIGYIPQGRDVFPRMTIAENLQVGELINKRRTQPAYDRVFSFFPILRERAGQRAGTLSGGQQQQLAIGRVMVGKPDLMLLDEPSEGIQPSIVKDIAANIVRLNREHGITVLFVEQNLDMILSMAQRCYVMDKGRIIAEIGHEELDRQRVV